MILMFAYIDMGEIMSGSDEKRLNATLLADDNTVLVPQVNKLYKMWVAGGFGTNYVPKIEHRIVLRRTQRMCDLYD